MNPLMGIPAKVRLWLYVAYGAAGLVISSVATYCTAVGSPVPRWSVGSAAVLASVGVAFGATAASNVTRDPKSTKSGAKDAAASATQFFIGSQGQHVALSGKVAHVLLSNGLTYAVDVPTAVLALLPPDLKAAAIPQDAPAPADPASAASDAPPADPAAPEAPAAPPVA